jgi:hypothetical protein
MISCFRASSQPYLMVLVRFPQWRVAERGQQKRGQDLKVDVAMYTEVERCHGNCDLGMRDRFTTRWRQATGDHGERDRLAWIDYLGQICARRDGEFLGGC